MPHRRHIPDRCEHLVRYVGWYSNRARGERAKGQGGVGISAAAVEPMTECASRAGAAWARLIRKVCELFALTYHPVPDIA